MADSPFRTPRPGDRPLTEIVRDISQKTSVLVREEIELAKTELTEKVGRLGRGAVAGVLAGVFAFLAIIFFLHTLAYFFADILDGNIDITFIWPGYLIVTGLLLLLAAGAGLRALRNVRRGTPPIPEAAIEEVKLTRQALEQEIRS